MSMNKIYVFYCHDVMFKGVVGINYQSFEIGKTVEWQYFLQWLKIDNTMSLFYVFDNKCKHYHYTFIFYKQSVYKKLVLGT